MKFLITTALFIAIFSLILVSQVMYDMEQLQRSASQSKPEKTTMTEIVMFCQKLAATTTKDNWNYKSCIEELGKTIELPTAKVL